MSYFTIPLSRDSHGYEILYKLYNKCHNTKEKKIIRNNKEFNNAVIIMLKNNYEYYSQFIKLVKVPDEYNNKWSIINTKYNEYLHIDGYNLLMRDAYEIIPHFEIMERYNKRVYLNSYNLNTALPDTQDFDSDKIYEINDYTHDDEFSLYDDTDYNESDTQDIDSNKLYEINEYTHDNTDYHDSDTQDIDSDKIYEINDYTHDDGFSLYDDTDYHNSDIDWF